MNPKSKINESVKQIFYVALIAYLVIILGRSIYKNYSINQKISDLENQIIAIRVDNENIKNSLLYYNTNSFKELEIRRRLGMQKPDEQVFLFDETALNDDMANKENQKQNVQNNTPAPDPNYVKWLHYLSGQE